MRRMVCPPLTDGSYVFFSFPHRHESWHVDGEDVVRELPLELETFRTLIKIERGQKKSCMVWFALVVANPNNSFPTTGSWLK